MIRIIALALAALPVALGAGTVLAPSPVAAQQDALAQVQQHLRSVDTMRADFIETNRAGQSVRGEMFLKRPGRIRFSYEEGVNILVVSDGRALTFVDYDVRQVQRWPIGDSPLSVLLNPDRDLAEFARVIPSARNSEVRIQARDPEHPEYGSIDLKFTDNPVRLDSWTVNNSDGSSTTVVLDNMQTGMPLGASLFSMQGGGGKSSSSDR